MLGLQRSQSRGVHLLLHSSSLVADQMEAELWCKSVPNSCGCLAEDEKVSAHLMKKWLRKLCLFVCHARIAHIHGQHGTMAVPNVHEITKAHSIGRHKHGIWSQHDMMQQINAMITSKSKHVNHNHPDDQEISSRGDGTSGGVLSSEIAPYYRRSAARTQYWNMNTIMEH